MSTNPHKPGVVHEMTTEEVEAWRLEHEYASLWHAVLNIEGYTSFARPTYGEPFERFKKSHPNAKSWKCSK